MKRLCFIFILFWPLVLYSQKGVSSSDFYQRLNSQSNILLLDVRPDFEYSQSRIPNALYAGEKKVLFCRLKDVSKTTTILVYCEDESRSKTVLKILKKRGYKNSIYLKGGFSEWQESHFPVDTMLVDVEK